jgi:hypothetical protein
MKAKLAFLGVIVLLASALVSYAKPVDQPHMFAARNALQRAKAELQNAEHNKGGHRANAVRLVNSAIGEVNRGITFDRRHNNHPSKMFSSLAAVDQPHMRAALDALRDARSELNAASADKGGHRGRALDLVNAAIDEVQKGIDAGA